MRILVVDDSAVIRETVMRAVRRAFDREIEFIEASDGLEALDQVADREPDIILCDWRMPKMTGIEALRELRERGTEIPFFFVMAEASAVMDAQAREAGAVAIITKPFTTEDFQEALQAYVR